MLYKAIFHKFLLKNQMIQKLIYLLLLLNTGIINSQDTNCYCKFNFEEIDIHEYKIPSHKKNILKNELNYSKETLEKNHDYYTYKTEANILNKNTQIEYFLNIKNDSLVRYGFKFKLKDDYLPHYEKIIAHISKYNKFIDLDKLSQQKIIGSCKYIFRLSYRQNGVYVFGVARVYP